MTNIRKLYGKILAFRNSIVDKPVQKGGFEYVKRFDKKLQLVKLVKKIQDEDRYLEVKGGKFILLEKGIQHCRLLYPTMP